MKASQAQREWELTALRGDISWLEDSSFPSVDCLAPPPPKTQTRAWDRIPVPTAVTLATDRTIYKRISAKQRLDRRYKDVVFELESQGFGQRKRPRNHTYARPYPDHVEFDTVDEENNSGTQDLALAREEVSIAYRSIWEDNKNIPLLSHKCSTYDPTNLTWTPRKRHNTRWPINPPSKDAEMIAHLQPLIKFELYSDQIDETALWSQDHQQTPQPEQKVQEEPQQVKKTNTSRRRTLRPSLSTILEESAENLRVPCLTPNGKTSPAYSSPVKQRSAAVDRFKMPTKVAGSPRSKFTLAATPEAAHFEITNEQGHFHVPSSTNTETTAGPSDTTFDTRGRLSVPSFIATDSPAGNMAPVKVTSYDTVPIFDQPADQNQAEPQHESKRRISLDNARRSDRRSDTKALRRSKNWVATTNTLNRRYSDVAQLIGQSRRSNRRHTLDVDVGRTLDIFAQPLPETETQLPPAQNNQANAQQEEKSTFDIQFEEFQQRKPAKINEIDLSAEIDEEVVKMYVNTNSTPKSENRDSAKPPEQSPTKYTPGKGIPWDDFKLFAGVKIVSPRKDISEIIPEQGADGVEITVSENIVPDAVNIIVDEEEATYSPDSEHEEEHDDDNLATDTIVTDMDVSIDIGAISDESDGTCLNKPTVDIFHDITPPVEGADETFEERPAEADETTTIEADKDTADDDSALALLHSFVRRAQTSKQSGTQDTVPILASTIAKKRMPGSMISATSDTGSPMAKVEGGIDSPSPRKPLEARDANRSPSPKKRKLGMETGEDVLILKKSGRLSKPDLDDLEPSQPRKRRKKMESNTDDIFNPDMDLSQVLTQKSRGGPGIARRSSRIATTKSSKTDNAQSEFSTIPVRLPGSSGMLSHDSDVPAVSTTGVTTATIQRKVEKDLATETRTNTRKNKAGAVPVPVALVALAQQPAGTSPTSGTCVGKGSRPGGSKTVRWDATLARVQGEEELSATTTTNLETQEAVAAVAVNSNDGKDDDDENLPSPPQMRHVGEISPALAPKARPGNPITCQLQEEQQTVAPVEPEQPEKKTKVMLTRRSTRSTTTASRLPMAKNDAPTPVAIPSTPKKSALPAPSRKLSPTQSSESFTSGVYEGSFDFGVLQGVTVLSADEQRLEEHIDKLEENDDDDDEEEDLDSSDEDGGRETASKKSTGKDHLPPAAAAGASPRAGVRGGGLTFQLQWRGVGSNNKTLYNGPYDGELTFANKRFQMFRGTIDLAVVGASVEIKGERMTDESRADASKWKLYSEEGKVQESSHYGLVGYKNSNHWGYDRWGKWGYIGP